ncbi:MAG TPA: class I SAM-dependent methyltransferase [Streptosporangiaceae bacterium]|nr:class I SAM-dependent methyltransferase [Streptosporangiaceae bacterium]
MPFKSVVLTPELKRYVLDVGLRLDHNQRWLLARSAQLEDVAHYQISPDQGEFLTLLVRAVAATRAIEVGTFTGYSSLCIAKGLPENGHLLCCDASERWTAIAKQAWQDAGVAHKIDLRVDLAVHTLSALPQRADIDFAFVDADEPTYWEYHNLLLPLLRPGALILYDNVLYRGQVVDQEASGNAVAIRDFNRRIAEDDRVSFVMLPFADGMTMVQKV